MIAKALRNAKPATNVKVSAKGKPQGPTAKDCVRVPAGTDTLTVFVGSSLFGDVVRAARRRGVPVGSWVRGAITRRLILDAEEAATETAAAKAV